MLGRYLCTRGIAPGVGIRRDRRQVQETVESVPFIFFLLCFLFSLSLSPIVSKRDSRGSVIPHCFAPSKRIFGNEIVLSNILGLIHDQLENRSGGEEEGKFSQGNEHYKIQLNSNLHEIARMKRMEITRGEDRIS